MLHLWGIGKSFASGSGGGEQNKIRKKVERLVVAFKRVAKKFHRRMETLVAHRRERGLYQPSSSLDSLESLRTPDRNPSPSATIRNAPSRPPNRTEVPRNKTCFRQAGNFICLQCACSRKRTKDTSESRFNQIDRPCLIANRTCWRTLQEQPRLRFWGIIL